MDYNTYLGNIEEKLSGNFDFMKCKAYGETTFDLVAKSHIRNEKYIASKKNVIYGYDNNEYCLFKHVDDVNVEPITGVIKTVKKMMEDFIEPSDEHMSTIFTAVIVTENPVEDKVDELVKGFKYQKSYKLGFHGWASLRLMVVKLDSGQLVASREAKRISRFYEPYPVASRGGGLSLPGPLRKTALFNK